MVDVAEVALDVTKLLSDGLADPALAWLLLFGHGEELLSGFAAVGAWLVPLTDKGGMEDVDDLFGFLPRFAQQFEVGRKGDICGRAGSFDDEVCEVIFGNPVAEVRR